MLNRVRHLSAACLTALLVLGCSSWGLGAVPVRPYYAVERKPFDAQNFTQGLEIHDGVLWVSSGQYGRSAVRRYDLATMVKRDEAAMPPQIFAEGLTRLADQTYLLTWRARRLLILDSASLSVIEQRRIPTEGWGITHHHSVVWYSDGSDRLYRFDTASPQPLLAAINVTLDGSPVRRLNELEWIDGEIWANVWQTDNILRIDPENGRVLEVIDLSTLYPLGQRPEGADVMNGIARDPDTGQIWVTGKYWPWLFAIEPVPDPGDSR